MAKKARIALVIIGRNEAHHLARSLPGLADRFDKLVYVDSGSTDGSQDLARRHGAEVVELDMDLPFTAARARNAGFAAVLADRRRFRYVQFMDGDCELVPGYIERAVGFLEEHPEYGMVCGRRVERNPGASIFNTLCDIEWDTPVGDADYCGGDVTVRVLALQEIEGYDDSLIAGEDPEVCVRLRQAGWKIYRLDHDMTLHDANMHRLGQWWRRNERAGYAFAEGAHLHGARPHRHWVRESKSNWAWGLYALFFAVAGLFQPAAWLALLVFPLQGLRLAFKDIWNTRNRPFRHKLLYGLNCYFAKIPQFVGQTRYLLNRLMHRRQTIIEYK